MIVDKYKLSKSFIYSHFCKANKNNDRKNIFGRSLVMSGNGNMKTSPLPANDKAAAVPVAVPQAEPTVPAKESAPAEKADK